MAALSGKIALVTGGNRGIGRGIALALAEAGADVAIAARDLEKSEETACETQNLGRRALALAADVTDSSQTRAMVGQTVSALGGLDILVNNAGILNIAPVETLSEEAFDAVFKVNVKGVFLCCQAAIPYLRQRGGGRIINISSVAGKAGFPSLAHYCASKHAVIGFGSALAKELAADNITVNTICPGIVWTQMWEDLAREWAQPGESVEDSWQRHQQTLIPQGRAQTPEDMGRLAVFLATAENVTGQAWNVDGGLLGA